MTSPLKTCLLICCSYLAATAVSVAQEGGKEIKRGFRVTLFNEWKGPELFVKTKKSYAVLKAHRMAYTKKLRLFPGEPIILFTKSLDPEGEEKYKPFAQFRIPASTLEPLLVLHWNAAAGKAGGKVIEFSTRRFGYGTYQLVNLSDTKIFGYIGDKKQLYACNPRDAYISSFRLENVVRTPITAYIANGDEPLLVFSTLTIHRERKRVILFFKAERNKLNRLVYRSQSLVDFRHTDE